MIDSGRTAVVSTRNGDQCIEKIGSIVARDELMTSLWSNDEYINDNALTVNISRLRSKLRELGVEDAIETRKGQGYILL